MTAGKRIALNVAATYGRSLYALVVGLFSGRWLLMALGASDYGLYGLIGGLGFLISFFNNLLTGAVDRFYAVSVGRGDEDDLKRWFSIALALHVVLAVVLVGVGYPAGVWAIRNFLAIPEARLAGCVDVYGFVCLDCFIGMVTVPFVAMFQARQYIAEVTVYGVVQTTVNLLVLGYMVFHPGDWLVTYAGWICAIRVVPNMTIAARARRVFPACRFVMAFAMDWRRMRQVADFIGGRFACMLGELLTGQGLAIVVNKYLGVLRNASLTVSNTVSGHVVSLSSSLSGAFMPAVMNLAGAGDFESMRRYAMRVCRLSTLAILVFALPLLLEIDEVLKLWLRNPPEGTSLLCGFVLVVAIVDRMTDGYWMTLFAVGDIRRYQLTEAGTFLVAFLLGWALIGAGHDIVSVGIGLLTGRWLALCVRLWFGRKLAGLALGGWLTQVCAPVLLLSGVVLALGALPKMLMDQSFLRVVLTTFVCLGVFLPVAWFVVLLPEERTVLLAKLRPAQGEGAR